MDNQNQPNYQRHFLPLLLRTVLRGVGIGLVFPGLGMVACGLAGGIAGVLWYLAMVSHAKKPDSASLTVIGAIHGIFFSLAAMVFLYFRVFIDRLGDPDAPNGGLDTSELYTAVTIGPLTSIMFGVILGAVLGARLQWERNLAKEKTPDEPKEEPKSESKEKPAKSTDKSDDSEEKST